MSLKKVPADLKSTGTININLKKEKPGSQAGSPEVVWCTIRDSNPGHPD
ncbi:protein of unknown function [Ruminococcaceae bacterium BL-4]|nr:protein of unknown function [Ruminococcaceae bacterium BL-4]